MSRVIDKGAPRGRTEPEPLEEGERSAPLPVLRLRRMGASDRLVEHLAGLWAQVPDDQADEMAAAMADMSDRELLVALVGEPEAGEDPDGWAAAADFPDDARRLVAMDR